MDGFKQYMGPRRILYVDDHSSSSSEHVSARHMPILSSGRHDIHRPPNGMHHWVLNTIIMFAYKIRVLVRPFSLSFLFCSCMCIYEKSTSLPSSNGNFDFFEMHLSEDLVERNSNVVLMVNGSHSN